MEKKYKRPDWLINRQQAWQILEPYARLFTTEKGASVYLEGDRCDHFYCLIKGSIEISKCTTRDSKKILGILSQGNFFGIPELIKEEHVVDAFCLKKSTIARFDRSCYFSVVIKHEDLILYFFHMMGSIIGDLQRSLVVENAELKVISYLYWLMRRSGFAEGDSFIIPKRPTHETIAAIVSLTRETVSRVLGSLKEQGIIDFQKESILVIDPLALSSKAWSDDPAAGYYGTDNSG